MSPAAAPAVRRILTVEDEPDHLMAVEMLFRGEPGIEFFGAATTAEADAILERQAIDLILLDLALPGEDGLSFCRRIKAEGRFSGIPIVAFSAFPRQIYESRALEVGCIDYLDKPFHPRELVAAVKRHLAGG